MTTSNNEERYGGKTIVIGGQRYLLAPLSMGAMKRFREAITKITLGTVTGDDALDIGLSVIKSSFQRNYPNMTPEFIEEELVDGANYKDIFAGVLEASGFKPQGKVPAENPTAASPPQT